MRKAISLFIGLGACGLMAGCAQNTASDQGLFGAARTDAGITVTNSYPIVIHNGTRLPGGDPAEPADGGAGASADYGGGWNDGTARAAGGNVYNVIVEIGSDTASQADQQTRAAATGTAEQAATQEVKADVVIDIQTKLDLLLHYLSDWGVPINSPSASQPAG